MSGSFLSPAWHRVANLKPRLHMHTEVARHRGRGHSWYTLRNAASGHVHRCSPAVYLLLGLLDGRHTVEQAWSQVAQRLDEDAPTQDEVIAILSELHNADLLQSDITPDVTELLQRRGKLTRGAFWQRVGNPMTIRLPLWNPDRFLARTMPFIRPLTGWFFIALWCAVVLPAMLLATTQWGELTEGAADRIFSSENLLLLALVFPVVKALHEMGHAYAVKAGGGAVHEMGLMFIVLLPMPYVDASASSAFRSRARRIGVGAAGMLVETFIAALAMYTWLLVEPGTTRAVAFSVMVVAGVSTVLFNGNPLLRYDGYYILSDLLAIPNLASRATKYWGFLVERWAFGVRAPAPAATRGERFWLLVYAPAALAARVGVMTTIALVISQRFMALGVALAVWTLFVSLVWPLCRMAWRVVAGATLAQHRFRAVSVSVGAAAGLAVLVGLVPMPLHTVAEGVVWLPEESIVRAGADGFAAGLQRVSGSTVDAGTLLITRDDPELTAKLAAASARVAALQAKLVSEQFDDRVEAAVTQRELDIEQSMLRDAQARQAELPARSASGGQFVVVHPDDLAGRFARRGDVLGYVLPAEVRIVRVLVRQNDVDLVRGRLVGIRVRLASDLSRSWPATMVREVPAASNEMPSKALTIEGGGEQAVDPRDQQRPHTLQRFFQFDIELPMEAATQSSGAHVWVRFDHGAEPVAQQAWRRVRQLLLSRFDD
jgi:putative peptide zinc metalloprotease protein